VEAAGPAVSARQGGSRGVEGVVVTRKGIRKMLVDNKVRLTVVVILTLSPPCVVFASDESTFSKQASHTVLQGNLPEQVLRLISGDKNDDDKVKALEQLFRATPVRQWEALLGSPGDKQVCQKCDRVCETNIYLTPQGPMIWIYRVYLKRPQSGSTMNVLHCRNNGRLLISILWEDR
jgi:hypothetical protein